MWLLFLCFFFSIFSYNFFILFTLFPSATVICALVENTPELYWTGNVLLAWGNCSGFGGPAVEADRHIWQGQSGLLYRGVGGRGQLRLCQRRGWVGPLMHVACCWCSWWGGEEGQWYLPGFFPLPASSKPPTSHLSGTEWRGCAWNNKSASVQ